MTAGLAVTDREDKKPEAKGEEPKKAGRPPKYFATMHPGRSHPLPAAFGDAVRLLEEKLGHEVLVLIQGHQGKYSSLDQELKDKVVASLGDFERGRQVTLLLDSYGGYAKEAYEVAMALRRHCGGFEVIVAGRAKSAATLLALGATRIVLGEYAELGPLDVQLFDAEREDRMSALDEIQALERLEAFALDALDRTALLLLDRTRKRVETMLPHACRFVSDLVRPLFEKIDTVHYSQVSRALKVAMDYGIRLLQPTYTKDEAEVIARKLVEDYSDHGFVVDIDEARRVGLQVTELDPENSWRLYAALCELGHSNVLGFIRRNDDEATGDKEGSRLEAKGA